MSGSSPKAYKSVSQIFQECKSVIQSVSQPVCQSFSQFIFAPKVYKDGIESKTQNKQKTQKEEKVFF